VKPHHRNRKSRPDDLEGYSAMPHRVTGDRLLSDAAYRALAALESWAWGRDSCYPSNGDVARRAGWVSAEGVPSVSKAKRALRELEGRGFIRRVVVSTDGETRRDRIQLLRPLGCTPGSNPTHPRVKSAPPPGSDLTHPPGSDLTPSEEAAQKKHPEGPASLSPGWPAEDLDRLEALADRLFPGAGFGRRVRASAPLHPPGHFEAALKAAAGTGKRIGFPYVLAICERYAADGGPPRAEGSARGQPSAGPPPIPYVVAPPNYKPYPKKPAKP
jgi:hypothetical protein